MEYAVYLTYPLLLVLLLWGCKPAKLHEWNEDYLSLQQSKMIQGFMAVLIMFHHMGQKTCAPWHQARYIVHGLDFFVPIGFLFVAVFLFYSGYGLYVSVQTKPDYLKHFPRRRILPIVAAFFTTNWIWLIVRLLMGQRITTPLLWYYLSGVQLANSNAWYVAVLPFFYLFFWVAFRVCKKDGVAIAVTTLLILCYITVGLHTDHNIWWMRGEWWYNTAIMFPLGMVFAKYRTALTGVFKKGYVFWLLLAIVGTLAAFWFSEYTKDVFSYYGQNWGAPDKVLRRIWCLGAEQLTCVFFVLFTILVCLKLRIGNRALAWLGGITLELYLMHGIFVDLFGYDFLEVCKSLVYIRQVAPYILAVIACAIPAAILYRWILKPVNRLLSKKNT